MQVELTREALLHIGVEKYLKSDRQWPRHMRIDHAQRCLNKAGSPEEQEFWKSVLDANGTLAERPAKPKWFYVY